MRQSSTFVTAIIAFYRMKFNQLKAVIQAPTDQ